MLARFSSFESADELRQQNRSLEDRISSLSAAVLRVSASLDLETVLREIVDSARAMTGASYGLITTIDDAGLAAGLRHRRLGDPARTW